MTGNIMAAAIVSTITSGALVFIIRKIKGFVD